MISLAPNNCLWLFYVSVSLGGWANINALIHAPKWLAPHELDEAARLQMHRNVQAEQ